MHPRTEDEDKSQFKMFQTIALSVAVAVAYIIAVLGTDVLLQTETQEQTSAEEPSEKSRRWSV